MKTKKSLEREILNITMKIHMEYPELYKFIDEVHNNKSGIDSHGKVNKNLKAYCDSLDNVLAKYAKKLVVIKAKDVEDSSELPGYPLYLPSEDIYTKRKMELELNPDDISKNKSPNEKDGSMNEKDFKEDMSGDDLDVPGAGLDDQQESVGSEDEENNYYSIGGDNHNDLEEDKG